MEKILFSKNLPFTKTIHSKFRKNSSKIGGFFPFDRKLLPQFGVKKKFLKKIGKNYSKN
jgi:hypothetical protein